MDAPVFRRPTPEYARRFFHHRSLGPEFTIEGGSGSLVFAVYEGYTVSLIQTSEDGTTSRLSERKGYAAMAVEKHSCAFGGQLSLREAYGIR